MGKRRIACTQNFIGTGIDIELLFHSRPDIYLCEHPKALFLKFGGNFFHCGLISHIHLF